MRSFFQDQQHDEAKKDESDLVGYRDIEKKGAAEEYPRVEQQEKHGEEHQRQTDESSEEREESFFPFLDSADDGSMLSIADPWIHRSPPPDKRTTAC